MALPAKNGQAKADSIWSRPPEPKETHVTDRVRKRVEGLPDWEPLPPGEQIVRRPRQD